MLNICCVLIIVCFFSYVSSQGSMGGPGKWDMKGVEQCMETKKDPLLTYDPQFEYGVTRRRINRTIIGLGGWMVSSIDLEPTLQMSMTVSKCVDGGCKEYQKITDGLLSFIFQYAEQNWNQILDIIGIVDKGGIPAGEYNVESVALDLCEMPAKAVYGVFEAVVNVLKDNVVVLCLVVNVEFSEEERNCPNDEE